MSNEIKAIKKAHKEDLKAIETEYKAEISKLKKEQLVLEKYKALEMKLENIKPIKDN